MTPEPAARLPQALAQAVEETLENMVFDPVSPVTWFAARVPVRQPAAGAVLVALPESFARQIAAGLFKVEPEDATGALLQDVVGELANTVAGRLVNALLAGQAAITLDLPERIAWPPPQTGEAPLWIQHFEIGPRTFIAAVEGEALLRLGQTA